MSELLEVFDLKENVLTKLIEDADLIKAILNETIVDDPTVALYENIFPYKKNFETVEEVSSFITMDYAISGLVNDNFKDSSITFYVIVHKDLIKFNYGNRVVLRTDYIAHRIDAIFNKTRGFGIGKLGFGWMRPVEVSADFVALAINYVTIDFN